MRVTELQIEVMKGVVLDAFQESLFRFARGSLAEVTAHLDDDALRRRIAEDVEAAHAMRIRSDSAVTRFVGFSLAGPRDERFYHRADFIALLDVPDPEAVLTTFLRQLQTYFEQESAKWASSPR